MKRAFTIAVLASGSKGNATLIATESTAVLVDCGVAARTLTQRLKECGYEPESIAAILITHEHTDHVRGIRVFANRHKIPVYTNENTWRRIPERLELERELIRVLPRRLTIGDLTISAFHLSHDAIDPVGYSLEATGAKCVYLTDTGYVTAEAKKALLGVSHLIIEANHDEQMLQEGPYPAELKRRVKGRYGHLANSEAAQVLLSLAPLPTEVFLAHLSEVNNDETIARQTVERALWGMEGFKQMKLYVARQAEIVSNKQRSGENAEESVF